MARENNEYAGIPSDAFDYFDDLAADNSRAFWAEQKHRYDASVRAPLLALAARLEPDYGKAHIYRPHRDVRFSKDKSPLKDHQGMYLEMRNGLGWYLQVSTGGLMAAGGWYQSTPAQLQRFREHIDTAINLPLPGLIEQCRSAGLEVNGEQLKTKPRGYPADHPRLDLLRYKTLYLRKDWEPEPWMEGPELDGRIRSVWESMRPLLDWLADTVGPGDPPLGRRRTTSS